MLKKLLDLLIHAPRRRIDVKILWPELLRLLNGDRVRAQKAFWVHAQMDPAYSNIDIDEFIRRLP